MGTRSETMNAKYNAIIFMLPPKGVRAVPMVRRISFNSSPSDSLAMGVSRYGCVICLAG